MRDLDTEDKDSPYLPEEMWIIDLIGMEETGAIIWTIEEDQDQDIIIEIIEECSRIIKEEEDSIIVRLVIQWILLVEIQVRIKSLQRIKLAN